MFDKNVQPNSSFRSQLLAQVLTVSANHPWWTRLSLPLIAPTLALAVVLFVVFATPLHTQLSNQLDSFTLSWQIDHTSPTPSSDQPMLAEEQTLLNL